MLINIRNSDNDIAGQIEYYIVKNKNILYIEEIAVFGKNQRKGIGERSIWDLFELHKHVNDAVGISTGNAIPFWKKLGAEISDIKDNGDCFFILNKWSLYNYLRGKYSKRGGEPK